MELNNIDKLKKGDVIVNTISWCFKEFNELLEKEINSY